MISSALSDLATNNLLQRQSRGVRTAMEAAGRELTTGQSADLRAKTGGDLNRLFAIDKTIAKVGQRQSDLGLAGSRAATAQISLGLLHSSADEMGLKLLAAIDRGDTVSARSLATKASSTLAQMVTALNTPNGGRYLFSGAAEESPALASAGQLISEVAALISGAADASSAVAAVDAYFYDNGGGFETDIYLGSTQDAAPAETTEGSLQNYLVRADARPIRDMLRGLAMTAAIAGGAEPAGGAASTVLREAASSSYAAGDGLVQLRASLGNAQQEIETGASFAAAQKTSFQIARNEIAGVDQFDAAAHFNALQGQLESVYHVTARLTSLRLTNFLR